MIRRLALVLALVTASAILLPGIAKAQPALDFFFLKPNTDTDPNIFDLDLFGALGFEWQLGWVEASRISLTLRLGAGLNFINANGSSITFATGGGSSVEGLFNTSFALTF